MIFTVAFSPLNEKTHTMSVLTTPEPRKRKFLPEEFRITVWSKLKPYYNELERRAISSVSELERWIYDWNEINALFREEINWRYIRLSIDTENADTNAVYSYIVQRILPKVVEVDHQLHIKLLESPFKNQLNKEQFEIYLRSVENSIHLFRSENIELSSDIKMKTKDYGRIVSQLVVEWKGEYLTLQQIAKYLESLNREDREVAYKKIWVAYLALEKEFDKIYDELLSMRHQIALNAQFDNYRDYQFKALGRFDYGFKDCEKFHQSIKRQVVPAINEYYKLRKKSLGLSVLKPWDTKVTIEGNEQLDPFKNTKDLLSKTINCLSSLDPYFGECLAILKNMNYLDLDTRKGKQPGGYNMPLLMTGVPFIFMNAGNSLKDLIVLTHESGHAVHSFSTRQYQLNSIKTCPPEIAELAAMSMELLAMEHWNTIFTNLEEERIARLQQLERVMTSLPWISQVDEFQHWIYVNHDASRAERKKKWISLCKEYKPESIDQEGSERYIEASWHRQLHIFELPFYYIEYGFAQLGAIAIWKNYRENPKQTIERFTYALSLGYSKSIPEIYEAAGITFDFSEIYIKSTIAFLKEEIEKCYFRVE